ncbi:uncharacterized protein PHACADRAFT_111833 [Phanerochaete carnosa HHB-10118-sp]|uniref:Uncharacterized protein n=1 Tax=Phanerochaete carnosa (strain HHB-10118-sp) TaxID=650164 RepID=K5WQ56_PHACS|nr:uncharacterized protein PHACADRAFT_111833 [Phanerochaete carnosa HHB-10118-sp]EKM61344.1 hypothetical protein PHACADRAFT_111833 [Phanerochaete carnosa HHB-10118-sp]
MAEAGPSTGNGTTPNAGTSSRHGRFPFPDFDQDGGILRVAGSSEGLSKRPIPGGLTHSRATYERAASSDGRRRVRSVDDSQPPYPSGLRHAYGVDDAQRRVAFGSRRGSSMRTGNAASTVNTDASTDYSSAAFSDEYDLSHEDPRILEDVQRALSLQARREARMKALHSISTSKPRPFTPDDASNSSSFSTRSSPVHARMPPIPPAAAVQGMQGGSVESEIDFSPSVGLIPPHPVPSSSNGGATLDWTGSNSEDERDKRWSLSITRRRHRDRYPAGASKTIVEKQESLYIDKLAQIKAKAKPHTVRKAAITAEQLRRRYTALGDPPNTQLNLLCAARWYDKQEPIFQASLDNAEPLTWLKHLLDKHGTKSSLRFPWHLSALIVEEYAKSLGRTLQPIPEDQIVNDITPAVDLSPMPNQSASPESKAASKSPSSDSWSWTPPPLEPSLSRKRRDSSDAGVSFEPRIDSGRSSAGADSRRSSIDPITYRRHSLAYHTDSTRSSSHNGVFSTSLGYGMSPSSSRMHFRDFASRMRRKVNNQSEGELSSARNSISEQSQEDESSPGKGKPRLRPMSLQLVPGPVRATSPDGRPPLTPALSSGGEGPRTARQTTPYLPVDPTVVSSHSPLPPMNPSPSANPRAPKTPRPRQRRTSLPSLNRALLREQEKQQIQADEEQQRRDYEHKTQLLEDTLAQNQRTRQLLQRVGGNIREYENVLSRLSLLLGISHTSIPLEVLEALSHDPASIMSGTRRLQGWRAVEDIDDLVNKQRDTLRSFAGAIIKGESASNTAYMFDGPIFSLSSSLDQLERHRERIAREAENVMAALAKVKETHSTVKREYNDVTAHTSLIYPEITQIVALEESYRNKYQQFWDIGLDALTLLLDTVTPVWRNYGKVIGEDVQDFFIIPWYRNEFTGEQKRYPIASLPRRSFQHWFGLFLFSLISIAITALQIGAAVSSTLNYNLPWISHSGLRWFFIPFFVVGLFIQWTAVIIECLIVFAEFGVVLWWLGWAVKIFN